MSRQAMYRESDILDAAAAMCAAHGVGAVTMAALTRVASVPSGSLYHRFPTRTALLAGLWTRTVTRYHDGAYPLFGGDSVPAAVAVAEHTIRWCRAHPTDAQVLLSGPDAFAVSTWPPEQRRALEEENDRWNSAVSDLVRRLRADTGHDTATVLLAAVDLPYAAVRRYLGGDRPIPPGLTDVVSTSVATLLGGAAHP